LERVEFPERFEVAAQAGFRAVEIQFPYFWEKGLLARSARRAGVEVGEEYVPAGRTEDGLA